jgi:monofunctional biosynthetic peptidoglycan transglycosylase
MVKRKTKYPFRPAYSRKQSVRSAACGIAFPMLGPRRFLVYILSRLPVTALGGVVVFSLAVFIFGAGAGFVFSVVNPPVTSLMLERYLNNHYPPRPVIFVSLASLPASVPRAFLRLEDKRFYTHAGVDPAAIENAYTQNKRWGRVIMGGSTITQQTVRSLFLSPDKNFLRKYIEAVMAISFDAVMDKHRILELYLNYIEWGRGVYGIGAAALSQYKKPVSRLTYEEFTRLAAIIINPLRYNVNTLFQQRAMAARYQVLNVPLAQTAADEKTVTGDEEEGEVVNSEAPDTRAVEESHPTPSPQRSPEEGPPASADPAVGPEVIP